VKQLYLMRHAKSSWKDPNLRDFERPLNKRGKRDAPLMGKRLKQKEVKPDLIISSFAKRAYKTAKIIAKELNCPKDKIIKEEKLYLTSFAKLLNYIKSLDNSLNSILIINHNPAISELFCYLSGKDSVNMPTSAIGAIRFDTNSWKYIDESKRKVLFFEYPKKIIKK